MSVCGVNLCTMRSLSTLYAIIDVYLVPLAAYQGSKRAR